MTSASSDPPYDQELTTCFRNFASSKRKPVIQQRDTCGVSFRALIHYSRGRGARPSTQGARCSCRRVAYRKDAAEMSHNDASLSISPSAVALANHLSLRQTYYFNQRWKPVGSTRSVVTFHLDINARSIFICELCSTKMKTFPAA